VDYWRCHAQIIFVGKPTQIPGPLIFNPQKIILIANSSSSQGMVPAKGFACFPAGCGNHKVGHWDFSCRFRVQPCFLSTSQTWRWLGGRAVRTGSVTFHWEPGHNCWTSCANRFLPSFETWVMNQESHLGVFTHI